MPRRQIVGVITWVKARHQILRHNEVVAALISAKRSEQHAAPQLDTGDHESVDRIASEIVDELPALPDIKTRLARSLTTCSLR